MADSVNPPASEGYCAPAEPSERLGDGRTKVRAPAKLNLTLRVGPIREDGYHPLDSVVVKITFYDELIFSLRDDDRLTLTCRPLPPGPDQENLVLRAAKLLQARNGGGADIELYKRIPVGAGLGGGSADAAVTLRTLNRLWAAHVPNDELVAIAAGLGADVPLFLGPPSVRMRGRGEKLDPISVHPFFALLVTPPVRTPTGQVYRAFDTLGPEPLEPFDPAVLADRPPSRWGPWLRNDLTAPAVEVRPAIAAWSRRLAEAVDQPVFMTGSGSGLFVLADDLAGAQALRRRLGTHLARRGKIVSQNPW